MYANLYISVATEDMPFPTDGDATVHEKEEEEDGDWIISLQSDMETVDPSPGHAPLPPDSSTLPCSTPPVQVNTMTQHTCTDEYHTSPVQVNAMAHLTCRSK